MRLATMRRIPKSINKKGKKKDKKNTPYQHKQYKLSRTSGWAPVSHDIFWHVDNPRALADFVCFDRDDQDSGYWRYRVFHMDGKITSRDYLSRQEIEEIGHSLLQVR